MIFRYNDYYNLYVSTKFVPRDSSFQSTSLINFFIFEIILVVFHPNIFAKNISFKSSTSWNMIESEYKLNDMFCALSMTRIIFMFFTIIAISGFYDARCNRIW
jgi:hypothetical protein